MSFAGQMSAVGRQEGMLLIRRRTQSTKSYGRYRPSATDFMKSFYAVLERWQAETAFCSNPDEITAHPSFNALVSNAQVAAPLILSELRRTPSLLVWVLEDAFPGERPYPNEAVGDIPEMTKGWLAWGEQHGRTL